MKKVGNAMNRRRFTQTMMGAAAAGMSGLPLAKAEAEAQAMSGNGGVPFHFSVMVWTLNKVAKTFDEALAICAAAGYEGVELTGEWHKWTDADYARIVPQMKKLGLKVDSMAGIGGTFADPKGGDTLLAGIKAAVEVANRLDCPQLLLTSGKRVEGTTIDSCVENLKRVMEAAEKAGKDVVIEPIDLLENPSAFLTSVTEGFEMCRRVGSPRMKVLYDVYHEQRQSGNLLEKFEKNIDLVGLIHIADVPGRHEPGTGEIRYDQIYKALGRLNYRGYMAMEFYPTGDPVAALKKARFEAITAAKG